MKNRVTPAVETLLAAIKNARVVRGLTQGDVARRIGRGQSRVSDIESGALDPRVSTVAAVARVLGLRLMLIPEEQIPAIERLISDAPGIGPNTFPTTTGPVSSVYDELFVPDPPSADSDEIEESHGHRD